MPPDAEKVTDPVELPLQSTEVMDEVLKINAEGSVTVIFTVEVHPFASFAVTA